ADEVGCVGSAIADASCTAGSLDLNDVSILFPLQPRRIASLVPASQVLPRSAFDRLPALVPDAPSGDAVYAHLYVVGIRIDPCFPGEDTVCRNQIRFVLQRVEEDGDLVHVEDAAVHVFYEVARSDFEALARSLLARKREPGVVSTGGPLRVHPALEA